jgi:hypothetical protein
MYLGIMGRKESHEQQNQAELERFGPTWPPPPPPPHAPRAGPDSTILTIHLNLAPLVLSTSS